MRRTLTWAALVLGPALLMGGCEMQCQSDEPKIVVDKPAATSDDGEVKVTITETPK
jgi:hypothetical protein